MSSGASDKDKQLSSQSISLLLHAMTEHMHLNTTQALSYGFKVLCKPEWRENLSEFSQLLSRTYKH